MCILIIKPSGVMTPNENTLKTCFERNPDGAGFSYNKGGKIILKKGFMTFESFKKAVEKIPVNSSALIHCRITTSGGTKPELTHPYPLDNDYKNMMKTKNTLEPVYSNKVYAVAHNGVFSGLGHHKVVNDTCEFIANFLKPLQDVSSDILRDDLDPVINRLVDTSRLAILDNFGNWKKYGNGWIEVDGIYYSNTSYKDYKVTTPVWGDYDDDEYYSGRWKDNLLLYENKEGKKVSYNEWLKEIVDEYGSYDEYLDALETERLDKLMDEYPDFVDDIMSYAEYGYCSWQIKQWIEQDYLAGNGLGKNNKK